MLDDRALRNIEAFLIQQGYDPEQNYIPDDGLPPGFLSPNFREDEFRSRGDGTLGPRGISPDLINALERIRAGFGNKPIRINSGYRDPAYNARIGGARNSRHTFGDAADFNVEGVSPADVYKAVDPYHTDGGLGLYRSFVHIDMRGYRARWKG